MENEKGNTSFRLTEKEKIELKVFCAQNGNISMQAFIKHAVDYCMKNKILPGGK